MSNGHEVNVEEIMAEIRENITREREHAATTAWNAPLAADLDLLQSDYDITRVAFTSHRKRLGPLIVMAKRILRRLLTPILARQVAYNAASARLTAALRDQVAHLNVQRERLGEQADRLRDELADARDGLARTRDELADVRAGLADVRAGLADARAGLADARDGLARTRDELSHLRTDLNRVRDELARAREETLRQSQALRERSARAERKLRRLLHPGDQQATGESALLLPPKAPWQDLEPDFDYAGMEERFRGSEEEIRERQRGYLEHFKGAQEVLDVGCGRGEFLELLREAGIAARGVDANLDMVLLCREKGLDVSHSNAFEYLAGRADESLEGIFAAMLIEHLQPADIVRFVRLCNRKLKPNGVVLLETPNPRCLTTMAWGFYLDFSHIWPCHPDAMRYVLETTGFRDIRVQFSSPVDSSARIPALRDPSLFGEETGCFNRAAELINELLLSCQDYAIAGRRI